jgi:anti-sigma regulatory factor (Ser/Thr protein kinase)
MVGIGERSGEGACGTQPVPAAAARWNFRVERDRVAIGRFNDALERNLQDLVPMAALRALQIAFDELLTNVLMHAEQAAGPVEVAVERLAGTVEASISYLATEFDPTTWQPPQHDGHVAGARIGGQGIVLVRGLMDAFVYRYDDGYNVIRLSKRC